MNSMLYSIGLAIARYLQKPIAGYEPFTRSDPDALRALLRPGDVLLADDVGSKGHISRDVGDNPLMLMAVGIDPAWEREG